LILGAIAFGAVFAAERQFASMGNDMTRYNKLRAMSGDVPMLTELLASAQTMVSDFTNRGRGEARGLVDSLTHDLVRYATMRGM
jgi:hypothetical protein